jgi:MFS transporter, CP family, cyanate transporter
VSAPSRLALPVLWLGGFNLRVTALAVPPVITEIHRDLGLDYSAIGGLTALPTFLLAVAAIPGSLLIAQLGARRALLVGMAAVAIGGGLRGLGTASVVLFAMTLLMGIGVALSQPAFPTLVKDWTPGRTGFATALYANGMLIGETAAAAATGALVVLLGHSWQLGLAVWSIPVLVLIGLAAGGTADAPAPADDGPIHRWPDFRSRQLWMVGLVFGLASAGYWGTNAFVPDFLHATGHPELQGAALTCLNASQLLASALALAVPGRLVGRAWPFVASGGLLALACGIIAFLPGVGTIVGAGLVGFTTALTLVLTLALPPLLAGPREVHTFSAGVFLICYLCAFVGPVVGGAAWDLARTPQTPFLVLGLAALLSMALATVTNYRPQWSAPVAVPGAGAP